MRKLTCLMMYTVLFGLPALSTAQSDPAKKLKQIFQEIKAMKGYGYEYTIHATFPDGTKDNIHGQVYSNVDKQILYSNSDAATIFYSGKWLYQANHMNKQVRIASTQSAKTRRGKNDLFKSDFFGEFIDSFILQYAKIESFSELNDTTKLTITFPHTYSYIHSMNIAYNNKVKMPINISVDFFYHEAWQKNTDRSGTTKIITCSNYTTKPIQTGISDFFSLKNGKPVLTKYKNYKLHTTL